MVSALPRILWRFELFRAAFLWSWTDNKGFNLQALTLDRSWAVILALASWVTSGTFN